MNNNILLTGFEPFANFKVNSSWEAVQILASEEINLYQCECLSVDYHSARNKLIDLLKLHRPDICLCTGLAEGNRFRLERQARKLKQFSNTEGPELFAGQWEWDKAMESFQQANLPAYFSEDAGKYVCESTYWSLLNFRNKREYPRQAAFLHVPPLSEDWPVNRIASGITAMLKGTS